MTMPATRPNVGRITRGLRRLAHDTARAGTVAACLPPRDEGTYVHVGLIPTDPAPDLAYLGGPHVLVFGLNGLPDDAPCAPRATCLVHVDDPDPFDPWPLVVAPDVPRAQGTVIARVHLPDRGVGDVPVGAARVIAEAVLSDVAGPGWALAPLFAVVPATPGGGEAWVARTHPAVVDLAAL
jgi:hypothetical protein